MFDTEKEVDDLKSEGADVKSQAKLDGGNIYGISQSQFVINVILLAALFSSFSFSFWLTDF